MYFLIINNLRFPVQSYVIAVVLVYGLSIVMLIASHIKRRHDKSMEDRQIEKYIQAVPGLKEKSARDTYKNLKRSIAPIVAVALAGSSGTTRLDGTRHSRTRIKSIGRISRVSIPKIIIVPPDQIENEISIAKLEKKSPKIEPLHCELPTTELLPHEEPPGSMDSGKCSPSLSLSTKSLLNINEECIDVTTVV